jgi:cell division protein FtsB
MSYLREPRVLIRRHLLSLIGISLCLYFSYFLLQGERSYVRFLALEQQTQESEAELARLLKEKNELGERVAMMRPGSIQKDLLEERIREVLGFRSPEELDLLEKD